MRDRRLIQFSILALISVGLALALVNGPSFSRASESIPLYSDSKESTDDGFRSVLEHVDQAGMVDYSRLKRKREGLDRFSRWLAHLSRFTYNSWDNSTKISFWVNAYNGLTLLAIIDNYPIESSFLKSLRFPKNSIRQISGVWDSLEFQIIGQPMTLDQIEHEILRKEFDDPRIHVALVCAAMGCPPLRNEPYKGSRLDEQLDDQARRFFGNPEKFRINRQTNTVYLSRILDWFGKDFINKFQSSKLKEHSLPEGAVLEFASRFVSAEDAEYLSNERYSVRYLDYDWSLNEREYD